MNLRFISSISGAAMLLLSVFGCKPENDKPATQISLDKESITLSTGETDVITATVTPENEGENILWTSDDATIATVADGTVTAIAPGTTTVRATAGDASACCSVTVTEAEIESITLDKTSITLVEGEKETINAEIIPEDTGCSIVWKSSDETIATVNGGEVTAVSEGSATITATAGNLDATCEVTVIKELKAPAKGDFYYSDGTWSTDLNSSKEVIGVVFWTGDPAKDDELLKKEHPDCKNGLVVSIRQGSSGMWQENYDSYGKSVNDWVKANATEFQSLEAYIMDPAQTGKMLGYNNTKAIEAFNAAPENSNWTVTVIEKIQEFRNEVPAPEASSGWYLPSVKELHLLCAKECEDINQTDDTTNRDFINSKLQEISGADLLPTKMGSGEGFVKTSTEGVWYGGAYPSRAYAVIFENGDIGESSKTFSPSVHRAILAF